MAVTFGNVSDLVGVAAWTTVLIIIIVTAIIAEWSASLIANIRRAVAKYPVQLDFIFNPPLRAALSSP
jgi:hypothetical protein